MSQGVPDQLDSRSVSGPIRERFSGLAGTVLMFVFAGPALYGVAYYLVAGELGRGEFRWSEVPSVLFWPLLTEFMFWMSWGYVETMLLFPLPTLLAATVFWLVNRQLMPSLNAMPAFRFVVFRSAICLVICVGAFLALNPGVATQGWDALYFYNPHNRHPFDDTGRGFLENYGPLFHLAVLSLASVLMGAIHGLSSWWLRKSRPS